VHFPTDLNLRKGLDMVEKLKKISELKGWRKIKHLRSTTSFDKGLVNLDILQQDYTTQAVLIIK